MDADYMEKTARDAVVWAEKKKEKVRERGGKQRDFVVVTFVSVIVTSLIASEGLWRDCTSSDKSVFFA